MSDSRGTSEHGGRSPEGLIFDAASRFGASLAGECPESLVADIAAGSEAVVAQAGEYVFRAGDPGDAAYFVVTGRLVILEETPHGQAPIRHLTRGEIFGEMALIDDAPRNASIRAERDSILARLPQEVFDDLSARYPEFLRGVAKLVIGRLTHPRPPADRVSTVALVGLTERFEIDRLVHAVESAGEHGEEIAVLAPTDLGEVEMDRAVDEAEARHRLVVMPIDGRPGGWSGRALRHADRVAVVVDPEPDAAQVTRLDELVAEARSAHHGSIWLLVEDSGAQDVLVAGRLGRRFGPERVLRFAGEQPDELARIGRLMTGRGVGLVLGGGGARGFAHIGVVRALNELGVPIDAVVGTSIGAVFAAATALGLEQDELEARVGSGFRRVLDYTLPSVGMIKARRLTSSLIEIFGDRDIQDLRIPFMCVSSNLTTARVITHEVGSVVSAVRASLAIPGVIPPVPHEGDLLIDGGVLNNLPVDILRASGLAHTIIAVDVAPPVGPGARHDYGLSVSGWSATVNKLGPGPRKYPRLTTVLLRSMLMGSMRERDRMVEEGYADLYLDLDLRGISMLEFGDPAGGIDRGYELAHPRIEAWAAAGGRPERGGGRRVTGDRGWATDDR